MQNKIFCFLTLLIACISSEVYAETLSGKVVQIADGDTLTIRTADNIKHKIRFAEIDAPEKDQPYGMQSRQHVADLCKSEAEVTVTGKDRYKRIIGRVYCDGVDVSVAQVQAGLAWTDPRYNRDIEVFIAAATAQEEGIGLWNDPDALPPWEWRKKKR